VRGLDGGAQYTVRSQAQRVAACALGRGRGAAVRSPLRARVAPIRMPARSPPRPLPPPAVLRRALPAAASILILALVVVHARPGALATARGRFDPTFRLPLVGVTVA